jgi:hypothetical protein
MIIKVEINKHKDLRSASVSARHVVNTDGQSIFGSATSAAEACASIRERTKYLSTRRGVTLAVTITIRFIFGADEELQLDSILATYIYISKLLGGEQNIIYCVYHKQTGEEHIHVIAVPVYKNTLSLSSLLAGKTPASIADAVSVFVNQPEILRGSATVESYPLWVTRQYEGMDFEDNSMPTELCEELKVYGG